MLFEYVLFSQPPKQYLASSTLARVNDLSIGCHNSLNFEKFPVSSKRSRLQQVICSLIVEETLRLLIPSEFSSRSDGYGSKLTERIGSEGGFYVAYRPLAKSYCINKVSGMIKASRQFDRHGANLVGWIFQHFFFRVQNSSSNRN